MSRRGWIMFAAMSVIWGLPYLLIKIAVGGVPVPVRDSARDEGGIALVGGEGVDSAVAIRHGHVFGLIEFSAG